MKTEKYNSQLNGNTTLECIGCSACHLHYIYHYQRSANSTIVYLHEMQVHTLVDLVVVGLIELNAIVLIVYLIFCFVLYFE